MVRTRSMSRCRTRGSDSSYLPEELIFKILSWTCVSSLLRCRSVCKLWLSIISNPEFIKAHQTNSHEIPSSILMITSKVHEEDPDDYFGRLAATLVYSDPHHSFNLPMISPFDIMEFISSCNGIVCVCNADGSDIYLLNPLTRMAKKLPPAVYTRGKLPSEVDVVFGFDTVSNDFKVLRIWYQRVNKKLVSVQAVHLYSLNADSVREIEVATALPSLVSYPHCPVLRSGPVLDGVLYLEGLNEIVTFDLHYELFGVIPFPTFMQTRKSNVFDYQGSVSVLVESVRGDGSLDDKEISLWCMEPVSTEPIWNKLFTFDNDFEIDWVFLCLGAKQFVGTTELGTVLYDSGKKVTKHIGIPSQSFLVTILKHSESFLSLQGFEAFEQVKEDSVPKINYAYNAQYI